jgi:hypothetical protein
MGGGMIMVSDMFNNALKARVADLAADLAKLLARDPSLALDEPEAAHVSLFVPADSGDSRNWWPAGLGEPTSVGAQDGMRYAYFAGARRLAIELGGRLTLYDTLDHQLGSFSQQQSRGGALTFRSQHGLVDLADLPVVATGEERR